MLASRFRTPPGQQYTAPIASPPAVCGRSSGTGRPLFAQMTWTWGAYCTTTAGGHSAPWAGRLPGAGGGLHPRDLLVVAASRGPPRRARPYCKATITPRKWPAAMFLIWILLWVLTALVAVVLA